MNGSLYITNPDGVNLAPRGCLKGFWIIIAVVLVTVALCLIFPGCKSVKPIATAPEVHNNTNDHDSNTLHDRRDSIYIHDSIYIREKGDTILKHIYHTEYRDRWKHDSIFIRDSVYIHDSIPYPVEVIKQVPVRNGYTRFTSWFFWIVLIVLLLWAAWKICDHIPACKGWTTAIKGFFKIAKWFK